MFALLRLKNERHVLVQISLTSCN